MSASKVSTRFAPLPAGVPMDTYSDWTAKDFARAANNAMDLIRISPADMPVLALFLVVPMDRYNVHYDEPVTIAHIMNEQCQSILTGYLGRVKTAKPEINNIVQRQLDVYTAAGNFRAVKTILLLAGFKLATNHLIALAAGGGAPSPYKHDTIAVLLTYGNVTLEDGILGTINERVYLETFKMVLTRYMVQGKSISTAEYVAHAAYWNRIRPCMDAKKRKYNEQVFDSIAMMVLRGM
jgi:hypothetical protein